MEGTLVVIGGGVMGRAIVEGGLRAGVLRRECVLVVEPEEDRRAVFTSLGCATAATPTDALAHAGRPADAARIAILLAIKPQVFAGVASELRPLIGRRSGALGRAAALGAATGDEGPLVVSIMAGVRAPTIAASLGGRVRVIRAMPNTPARVGQGVTGVAAGTGTTEADMAASSRLFAALGPVVERIDESLMDAFTAVAGSGPAYLFYLAQAMERAARESGFEAGAARRVVAQTLRGAAALLDGTDPAALRAAVTSKGGTTAAAVGVLEAERVGEAWVRAISAARDRGGELSRGG